MYDKLSLKGAWSCHVNKLNSGGHQSYHISGTVEARVVTLNVDAPMIFLERLKLESSNFARR